MPLFSKKKSEKKPSMDERLKAQASQRALDLADAAVVAKAKADDEAMIAGDKDMQEAAAAEAAAKEERERAKRERAEREAAELADFEGMDLNAVRAPQLLCPPHWLWPRPRVDVPDGRTRPCVPASLGPHCPATNASLSCSQRAPSGPCSPEPLPTLRLSNSVRVRRRRQVRRTSIRMAEEKERMQEELEDMQARYSFPARLLADVAAAPTPPAPKPHPLHLLTLRRRS